MKNIIENNKKKVFSLCKESKIKSLYAFGSVITDEFSESSDIDLLIDFEDNLSFEEYTDNYFKFLYSIEEVLNRKVDLLTQNSLSNPYFIENINKTKQLIYEQIPSKIAN